MFGPTRLFFDLHSSICIYFSVCLILFCVLVQRTLKEFKKTGASERRKRNFLAKRTRRSCLAQINVCFQRHFSLFW